MGGSVNFNHRNFETFTWAAGLAASTDEIGVFATFHVPTVHPVRAAKEVVTIDHISGGRFGLNIVAGWNEREIAMFGKPQKPMMSATTSPMTGYRFVSSCGHRMVSSTTRGRTSTPPAATPSQNRCNVPGRH